MPSRAWVVTLLASCLMDLLLLFQCPHGLELLRLHKTRISFLKEFQCPHGLELLLIMDGMPVQRIRFNALSGLSCYNWLHYNIFRYHCCFNALSGLSCYASFLDLAFKPAKFQCPLGLELLPCTAANIGVILKRFNALSGLSCYYTSDLHFGCQNVSMPSRAWVVTFQSRHECCVRWMFQCPLGLELLQQECPIF